MYLSCPFVSAKLMFYPNGHAASIKSAHVQQRPFIDNSNVAAATGTDGTDVSAGGFTLSQRYAVPPVSLPNLCPPNAHARLLW